MRHRSISGVVFHPIWPERFEQHALYILHFKSLKAEEIGSAAGAWGGLPGEGLSCSLFAEGSRVGHFLGFAFFTADEQGKS